MEISSRKENDETVVTVSGCLDTAGSADFATALEGFAAKSPSLVLDLSGLEFIASSALRALVSLEKRLKAQGGGIALANPNDVVREVFEVTGLDEVFPIR